MISSTTSDGGAGMSQAATTRRVRGYRIHVFLGAGYQPPSYTTPILWRETPPTREWQQLTSSPGIHAGDSPTLASESSCFISASPPWFHAGLVLRRFHRQQHRKPCGGKTQPFGQDRIRCIHVSIVMGSTVGAHPCTNL
jgi:hypothetical protein